jgi:antitoxin ParD1/3/4
LALWPICYASAEEYLSELVRQDQERLDELRRMVDEGLASGISTRTVDEIFAHAMQRSRERGLLNDE